MQFEGKVDKDSLTKWIKENYHGLVGHRTPDNGREFKEPLVVAYFDVDYVKNVKGTNYWRNRIMKVAQNFKSLNFIFYEIATKSKSSHKSISQQVVKRQRGTAVHCSNMIVNTEEISY